MTTSPHAETWFALLLLFIGVPACIAVAAGLVWLAWTWPYHVGAALLLGFAVYCLHLRVSAKETK